MNDGIKKAIHHLRQWVFHLSQASSSLITICFWIFFMFWITVLSFQFPCKTFSVLFSLCSKLNVELAAASFPVVHHITAIIWSYRPSLRSWKSIFRRIGYIVLTMPKIKQHLVPSEWRSEEKFYSEFESEICETLHDRKQNHVTLVLLPLN